MKKLTLQLDDLRIDSFATTAGDARAKGTVHARSAYDPSWVDRCPSAFYACEPTEYEDTCAASCGADTCAYPCATYGQATCYPVTACDPYTEDTACTFDVRRCAY